MKKKAPPQLEKLQPGLPFLSNEDFCQLAKSPPEDAPAPVLRQMLLQAVDRIGSQIAAPLYRVVGCRQTSASNPSQWDGELVVEGGNKEAQTFFIRFIEGSLKLYIDDTLVEFVVVEDEPDPGRISIERAALLLSRMLVFPDLSGGKLKLIK